LRFSLISITSQGQDVYLSKERFEQGRNFANKIWNASRFVLMNLDKEKVRIDLCVFFNKEDLDLVNRWILSRFYSTLKEVNKLLDNFKFNEALNLLYSFFWHEFCDWYLEIIKSDIKNINNQIVMYKVLEKYLRILHPFMPFITEEIWQKLPHQGKSIMIQSWPHIQEQIIDKKTESKMNLIFEIIAKIRNMRQEIDIDPKKEIAVFISTNNKINRELTNSLSQEIKSLAKLNVLEIKNRYMHTKSSITSIIKDIHITIPLEGLVDIEKEKQKLDSRIKTLTSQIKAKENLLSNKEFVKKADKEIVEKEKVKVKELRDILKRVELIKNELQ
ncbi:MAG: class I tRNA ligase family protein, partial [Candidatus Omnitrophota bacterium]